MELCWKKTRSLLACFFPQNKEKDVRLQIVALEK